MTARKNDACSDQNLPDNVGDIFETKAKLENIWKKNVYWAITNKSPSNIL